MCSIWWVAVETPGGDIITFCADQVKIGGHVTATITQFSDQGQPAPTNTPRSR